MPVLVMTLRALVILAELLIVLAPVALGLFLLNARYRQEVFTYRSDLKAWTETDDALKANMDMHPKSSTQWEGFAIEYAAHQDRKPVAPKWFPTFPEIK